jgi:ankyrin repeat protein
MPTQKMETLHEAIDNQNIEQIEQLDLSAEELNDSQIGTNEIALTYAINYQKFKAIPSLIKKGASLFAPNSQGQRGVDCFLSSKKIDVALLTQSLKLEKKYQKQAPYDHKGDSMLMTIAKSNCDHNIKDFKDEIFKMDFGEINKQGKTALLEAVENNNFQFALGLFDKNVPIKGYQKHEKDSPTNVHLLHILEDKTFTHADNTHLDILQQAVREEIFDNMMSFLGANFPKNKQKNHDFQTLISQGCDFDMTNAQGNSPIMICAKEGNMEAVEFLAQRGARMDMLNQAGENILTICHTNYQEQMQDLLDKLNQKLDSKTNIDIPHIHQLQKPKPSVTNPFTQEKITGPKIASCRF